MNRVLGLCLAIAACSLAVVTAAQGTEAQSGVASDVHLVDHHRPTGTKHFSSKEVKFRYPSMWHARTRGLIENTSGIAGYSSIVALSPQHMRSECVYTATSVDCPDDRILPHLKRNSLLAIWSSDDPETWSFRKEPGKLIKVDGRRAKWHLTHHLTKNEAKSGATTLVTVEILNPGHSAGWPRGSNGYIGLYAQLRGPRVKTLVKEIHAVLHSVRWPKAS